MKVKEESEKTGLKLNIQKTKIMASDPIASWQIDGETMGILDHLTCCLRNLYAGQEATVKTGQTGSRLGNVYIKAVYYYPAYLPYMQSTSYKILGWMKHKLESRLPGEMSITSDMQMTPPLRQKVKKN